MWLCVNGWKEKERGEKCLWFGMRENWDLRERERERERERAKRWDTVYERRLVEIKNKEKEWKFII